MVNDLIELLTRHVRQLFPEGKAYGRTQLPIKVTYLGYVYCAHATFCRLETFLVASSSIGNSEVIFNKLNCPGCNLSAEVCQYNHSLYFLMRYVLYSAALLILLNPWR